MSIMKCGHKVGDKVKVRSDLSSKVGASWDMVRNWAGMVVTISAVEPNVTDLGFSIPGSYHIEEDDGRGGFKYLWHDHMFEDVTPAKTGDMPELKTGVFGKTNEGDLFVVVGDLLVYKDGSWDNVADYTDPELNAQYDDDMTIDVIYDACCFDGCDDESIIWKRGEVKEAEETEEDIEKELNEIKAELCKAIKELLKSIEESEEEAEG